MQKQMLFYSISVKLTSGKILAVVLFVSMMTCWLNWVVFMPRDE